MHTKAHDTHEQEMSQAVFPYERAITSLYVQPLKEQKHVFHLSNGTNCDCYYVDEGTDQHRLIRINFSLIMVCCACEWLNVCELPMFIATLFTFQAFFWYLSYDFRETLDWVAFCLLFVFVSIAARINQRYHFVCFLSFPHPIYRPTQFAFILIFRWLLWPAFLYPILSYLLFSLSIYRCEIEIESTIFR